MLEKILRMYITATYGQVYSPVPHLFGPPGCGKSTIVKQAAELLDVNLHTINVSRISPLELEGVQMPIEGNTRLRLLTATFWTQLKDGDILLLDEFLRGFPEVYNGLLDILTAREVGGYKLPEVFIIAASNSTVAYDKALEDRLLHLPMPDPRRNNKEREHLQKMFVEEAGMLPSMHGTYELNRLFDEHVLPMYDLLDELKKSKNRVANTGSAKGTSMRNLLGQVHLREIHSLGLSDVIGINNQMADTQGKYQYLILPKAQGIAKYKDKLDKLSEVKDKLSPIQKRNLFINQRMIEMVSFTDEMLEEEKEEAEHEAN